jgi:hypothetical protein
VLDTEVVESVTMTEPDPNSYRPVPGWYPPSDAAPERHPQSTPDGLGWWTSRLLTLMGIVATADRQAESTKQAMKVVIAGYLVLLVGFGAILAYAVINSIW